MKKFLTILLTIVTISVNAQYIIYRSGNAYYYNNSTATWTKLDTTLVRILAGITHTTLAYGDHNHSGIYLPISGTAANSLLFMGKDTNQLKASWAPKIPFLISGNNYPTSSTYVSFDEKYNDIITYGPNSSVAAINQQSNGNGSNQTKVLLEILVNGDGKSTNLGVYRGHIDLNVSSVTTYDKTLKVDSVQGTKINDTTLISYIKYHAPAGTFNDSILKYNSTRKTFTTYSTKPSHLAFYRNAAMPDGTDTLKFNGLLNATGFVGENKPYGGKLEIITTDDEYPFGTTIRLRQKNYAGVLKTMFDFTNDGNAFKYNSINGDHNPFFLLTWMDSARFYQEGYCTKIGDIVKNNYWKFWYNGKAEQIINDVVKLTIYQDGMIKIGNDTVPVRKPMAADTVNLTGRIGDTFIDSTSKKFWYNTKNGRGGWVKVNYIIPFVFFYRRKRFLTT